MLRTYLRISHEKELHRGQIVVSRAFKPIGWYCQDCIFFNLDTWGIIENIIKGRFLRPEWDYFYVQRIYFRTRDNGRKFKAFAKYDIRTKLFITDDMEYVNRARDFRAANHLPPEVDYVEAYLENRRQADKEYHEFLMNSIQELQARKQASL